VVLIERVEVAGPLFVLESRLSPNHLDRSISVSKQLLLACGPEERCAVATADPPSLLLPAAEAGRSIGDFIGDVVGNRSPASVITDPGAVGELGVERCVCTAVSDAPWA
jgi:hypothetical protein